MREEGVCGARPVCVPVAVSVHLSGLGIVVTELAVQAHVSETVAAELVHQDGVSDEMTMAAELGILDGKVAASALAVSRMMGIVRRTIGQPGAVWADQERRRSPRHRRGVLGRDRDLRAKMALDRRAPASMWNRRAERSAHRFCRNQQWEP